MEQGCKLTMGAHAGLLLADKNVVKMVGHEIICHDCSGVGSTVH